jgi:type IV fimbrial biogenesis protein FimT
MRAISAPAQARGFTLVEALVAMAVLGLVLGIGIPSMANWATTTKARAASEFYAEGMEMARNQALAHNSASRLVLSSNAASGQFDWQVDVCFPTAAAPCNDSSGDWSTTTAPAASDPAGTTGFKSVQRSANALPPTSVLHTTLTPSGAQAVYFTPIGWVDQTVTPSLASINLAPAKPGAFRASAVVVTLAGTVSKCDPNVAAHDSRGCPQ